MISRDHNSSALLLLWLTFSGDGNASAPLVLGLRFLEIINHDFMFLPYLF